MDEKIIIQLKPKNSKKLCRNVILGAAVLPVLYWLKAVANGTVRSDGALPFVWFIYLAFVGFVLVLQWGWSKIELTVSDKRVYGCASFGRRVDLPLDSISAAATGLLSSIAITTASGAIKFYMIDNVNEVYKEITQLLVERQNKAVITTVTKESPTSGAAELKQYKDLLDSGVISQEEFDAKKKQLLNL